MPQQTKLGDYEKVLSDLEGRSLDACMDSIPGYKTTIFTIKMLTPMMGGMEGAPEFDKNLPIRGSTVRGHLRFWWRATKGASCDTIEDLLAEERRVWGGIAAGDYSRTAENDGSTCSLVLIRVSLPTSKKETMLSGQDAQISRKVDDLCRADLHSPSSSSFSRKFTLGQRFGSSYVLFPLKSTCGTGQAFTFRLSCTYPPEIEDDVMASMWAWCNFGGIGPRTRRGLGAIYCEQFAPSLTDARSAKLLQLWYEKSIRDLRFSVVEKPRVWPTLPIELVTDAHPDSVYEAWITSVATLYDFRQGRGGRKWDAQEGGKSSKSKPGRSYWLEADTVRRLSGRHSSGHEPQNRTEYPDGFPRAAFGLPITIRFRDGEGRTGQEPAEVTLVPADSNRLASPILLRPLGIRETSQAIPIFLRLSQVNPLSKIRLIGKGTKGIPEHKCQLTTENVISESFSRYPRSPMKNVVTGSALDAFEGFVKKQWGGE